MAVYRFFRTLDLQSKVLSLGIAKKNEFSFGISLAYLYLCNMMKTKLMILILVLVLPMVITAQDDQTDADSVAQADGIELADSVMRVQRPFRQVVLERIDSLMTDTLFETSQIGLMIWDLTDDTQLYSLNARQLMRPASTMKLLTAITALDKLGPGYRYTTSL